MLESTEEAVVVYRRLEAANPAAFQPYLAGPVNNLCIRLSGQGRREQALGAIEEAVEIRRQLAAIYPAALANDLDEGLQVHQCLLGLLEDQSEKA